MTGATSGIGQETAVGLAARGAQVVIVGRDRARAEAARKDVAERSGNPHVDVLLADFASLQAVRGLAREFCERYPALHVLVNNAGVEMTRRTLTVDGHETTLAVNHLAPFLLTHLLRERLLAGAPARVVNVASDAHRFARPGSTSTIRCPSASSASRASSRACASTGSPSSRTSCSRSSSRGAPRARA